jgi:hypothetical protein
MALRLRDNLHWCDCAGRIVFLDVATDRYFCLPGEANKAFLALAGGTASPQDIEGLRSLTDRGLLVDGPSQKPLRRPAAIEEPARDVLGGPVPRSGPMSLLRALAWEAHAAWQLKTRRFPDVIAGAGRRCTKFPGKRSGSGRATLSIAAAADRIALVTRSHNRCLVRALAVHAACRARGIPARLVLGVIAHPFAAHCWVQYGDSVLVGGYEQARLYTPILVLE